MSDDEVFRALIVFNEANLIQLTRQSNDVS